MQILRSPDDALDGLDGYPAARRWVEVPAGDGRPLRIHMVDVNPDGASVVVMLHGNPSWSYLWRHQIGPVVPPDEVEALPRRDRDIRTPPNATMAATEP